MFKVQKFLPDKPVERHGTLTGVFNDEEIERIQFFEKILEFNPAKIGTEVESTRVDSAIRECDVAWFGMDQNTQWLWEKIGSLVSRANYDLFLYDIDCLQSIQYTIYNSNDESQGDHYHWHRDDYAQGYHESQRVISGTILLSDPNEDFEGGEFEIDVYGNLDPQTLTLNKGDMFFFDSTMTHRVKPVTSGKRKTLVFWVLGKKQIA